MPENLEPHQLQIVLLQPQIAPNTGNIARLCVATGTHLHLVRPMGFILGDRQLRRSAMDYWPRLKLTVHDDDAAFFASVEGKSLWYFSTRAGQCLWSAHFGQADYLVFGSETHGIADTILHQNSDRTLRIPQSAHERCLNLATAAGIGLYEALRQIRSR